MRLGTDKALVGRRYSVGTLQAVENIGKGIAYLKGKYLVTIRLQASNIVGSRGPISRRIYIHGQHQYSTY